MSDGFQFREKGTDRWFNPARDIANLMPTAVVVGSVMALDTRSDVGRLYAQLNPNPALREEKIRAGLKYILSVIQDVRGANYDDVWDPAAIEDTTASMIFMGSGMFMMRKFAVSMRRSRLVDVHGGHQDPSPDINHDAAWMVFDSMLRQLREETACQSNS